MFSQVTPFVGWLLSLPQPIVSMTAHLWGPIEIKSWKRIQCISGQYAKLARKIGLGEWLQRIEEQAKGGDPWVQRYYAYFKEYASH